MSVSTTYEMLSPEIAAYISVPPGYHYPAEINQLNQRDYTSTKHTMNVNNREAQGFNISNYHLDQYAALSNGLNCKNTNSLGARPNKDPTAYPGACSGPKHPYDKNAGVLQAAVWESQRSPERIADMKGNYGLSMGDMEMSTSLLGAPPLPVQLASSQGSTNLSNGINATGLQGMNFPPVVSGGFYSPLPATRSSMGMCSAMSRNRNISMCNNGQ